MGHQMKMGLSTAAIFGDLNGYFFGNFRDKASNIRYSTPCQAVTDCKMNHPKMTLSDYFMSKFVFGQHFLTHSVWHSKLCDK